MNGFIDVQINGYAGIDFNGPPLDADQLHRVCRRLSDDGVASFLPTFITADLDTMCQRAATLVKLREADALAKQMIVGIHYEGPFLSDQPGYIGAHPPRHACDASLDAMQRLLHAANGLTRIVTLAPERDRDSKITAWLAQQKIIVSAGHTDASLDQLRHALDAGLLMFTHLGNGCPAQMHRHDNIIQRVLHLADRLWISFIADGHHVPPYALHNYMRLCNPAQTIVVTDAIAAAGLGPGIYQLGSLEVEVTSEGAAWAPGRKNFAGAAVTMPQTAAVLRDRLQFPEQTIRQLLIDNPQRLLAHLHP